MDEYEYGYVALTLCAECGAELIVGGLCESGAEERCIRALFGLMELRLTGIVEPDALDKALAQKVCELADEKLWAVGVSASVSGLVHSSGGVLGNPHIAPQDASKEIDDIGHGLYLLALPGGPGMVLACKSPEEAKGAFQKIKEQGAYDRKRVESIGAYIKELELEAFMAVTDGSGTNTYGQLMVFACGEEMVIRL